ncbi:MAG: hypothetical protein R3C68_02695 [Myxococcota bacterium]
MLGYKCPMAPMALLALLSLVREAPLSLCAERLAADDDAIPQVSDVVRALKSRFRGQDVIVFACQKARKASSQPTWRLSLRRAIDGVAWLDLVGERIQTRRELRVVNPKDASRRIALIVGEVLRPTVIAFTARERQARPPPKEQASTDPPAKLRHALGLGIVLSGADRTSLGGQAQLWGQLALTPSLSIVLQGGYGHRPTHHRLGVSVENDDFVAGLGVQWQYRWLALGGLAQIRWATIARRGEPVVGRLRRSWLDGGAAAHATA